MLKRLKIVTTKYCVALTREGQSNDWYSIRPLEQNYVGKGVY